MGLKTLQRTTLPGQVIAQVQESISRGEWPVGSKIPAEGQLAAELGVGRSTVREALRAMAHFGMLDIRPGDGTYVRADNDLVASLSRAVSEDALEGIEVRNSLERDAARLAAQRRTDRDLAVMREQLRLQRAAYDAGDDEQSADADLAFHQAVVAAAHNRVFDDLYANLTVVLRRSIEQVLGCDTQADHDRMYASHKDLVEAIERQDAAAADTAASTHLALAEGMLRRAQRS